MSLSSPPLPPPSPPPSPAPLQAPQPSSEILQDQSEIEDSSREAAPAFARATNATSTSILHSIFDESLGLCFGDYSCSYNRQTGRIYISNKAILFYSNLFGFERRLCLLLNDVMDVKMIRTTSILIEMVDGEEFCFRSISADRQKLVQLIKDLMAEDRGQSNDKIINRIETSNLHPSNSFPPPPSSEPLRFRAHSAPTDMSVSASPPMSPNSARYQTPSPVTLPTPSRKTSIETVTESVSVVDEDQNVADAWGEVKASLAPYGVKVVEQLTLPISLNSFHDHFLADHASHSIPKYQQDSIGDTEIKSPRWTAQGSQDSNSVLFQRTIKFRHPINNSTGIGPTSALARRIQQLWRFGDCGIRMETKTHVDGIPAADCFHVADRWLIDGSPGGGIELSIQVDIIFTKRTMFKSLIEKSTKKEIHRWYQGYLDMVKREVANLTIMASSSHRDEVKSVAPETVEAHETPPPSSVALELQSKPDSTNYTTCLLACCLLLFISVIFQFWYTQTMIVRLQQDIVSLQRDQAQMMVAMVRELQQQQRGRRETDKL